MRHPGSRLEGLISWAQRAAWCTDSPGLWSHLALVDSSPMVSSHLYGIHESKGCGESHIGAGLQQGGSGVLACAWISRPAVGSPGQTDLSPAVLG